MTQKQTLVCGACAKESEWFQKLGWEKKRAQDGKNKWGVKKKYS